MKKVCLVIIACCIVISTFAQSEKKNLIGTSFALGTDDYSFPGWVGGGSYEAKYYFSTGLDYARMLSKHWDICTGLKFTRSNMRVHPAPGIGGSPSDYNLQLVTIPAQMKYHFGKYFYVNGGLLFNLLARTSDETWTHGASTNKLNLFLGCGLGVGFAYEFSSGITLSFNPYFTWNGIENVNDGESFLKFLQKTGNISGARYLQGGVCVGVGYKF